MAFRSKLHGIPNQIEDHLSDSTSISHEVAGNPRRIVKNQIHAFAFRHGGQHFHDIFDNTAKVEVI